MAKLRISIHDPKIEKIMDIVTACGVKYTLNSAGLVIDASNPDYNEELAQIMKISADYTLS